MKASLTPAASGTHNHRDKLRTLLMPLKLWDHHLILSSCHIQSFIISSHCPFPSVTSNFPSSSVTIVWHSSVVPTCTLSWGSQPGCPWPLFSYLQQDVTDIPLPVDSTRALLFQAIQALHSSQTRYLSSQLSPPRLSHCHLVTNSYWINPLQLPYSLLFLLLWPIPDKNNLWEKRFLLPHGWELELILLGKAWQNSWQWECVARTKPQRTM